MMEEKVEPQTCGATNLADQEEVKEMEETTMTTTQPYSGTPWWIVLLEGIAAAMIGIMLFATPGATMVLLVQVLGWYWLIWGILSLVMMFMDTTMWGLKLFGGLLGIMAGILIIQSPLWATVIVPTVAVFIIGIDGVLIGGVDIIKAFQGSGWGVGVLGVMSLLVGLYLMFNPLGAAVAMPWVLGAFALVGGGIAIIASFSMRSAYKPRAVKTPRIAA